MKNLIVRKIDIPDTEANLEVISKDLDQLGEGHLIDVVNWEEYDYKPRVRFNIAHNGREIFIKYYVEEESVKAEMSRSNDKVCQDSCVEFFVSPDPDGIYYNFEFNPIGTCLLGIGTGRRDNRVVDPSVIEPIRRKGSKGTAPFPEMTGDQSWDLVVAIPVECFAGKKVELTSGRKMKANFYKCGDKLTKMHFLTWNPVDTAKPDFHRPEHFGELIFE